LITGESGTGKELIAHAIHRLSTRSEGSSIDINCAAFQESLLESELFGYEAGAFSGAKGRKLGLIELADGRTLFLDEVTELPPSFRQKCCAQLRQEPSSVWVASAKLSQRPHCGRDQSQP